MKTSVKKEYVKIDPAERFSQNFLEGLEKFEKEKKLPWVKEWRSFGNNFQNYVTKYVYKGIYNQLALAISGYEDPRFLSFLDGKNLGVFPNPKSAISLFKPNIYNKKVKDEETGEEKKEKVFSGFSVFNVHNVTEFKGLEIEPFINENIKTERDKVVYSILEKLEVNLDEKGDKAHYKPSTDTIHLPKISLFDSSDNWSSVALHELIHWTSKKERMDRDLSKYHVNNEERAKEELIAEIGCMRLCQILEVNGFTTDNHFAYISNWKKAIKDDKSYLGVACREAEKAVRYILEKAEIKTDTIFQKEDKKEESEQ